MQGKEIFLPFVGMLVLTFVVWVVLYARRSLCGSCSVA